MVVYKKKVAGGFLDRNTTTATTMTTKPIFPLSRNRVNPSTFNSIAALRVAMANYAAARGFAYESLNRSITEFKCAQCIDAVVARADTSDNVTLPVPHRVRIELEKRDNGRIAVMRVRLDRPHCCNAYNGLLDVEDIPSTADVQQNGALMRMNRSYRYDVKALTDFIDAYAIGQGIEYQRDLVDSDDGEARVCQVTCKKCVARNSLLTAIAPVVRIARTRNLRCNVPSPADDNTPLPIHCVRFSYGTIDGTPVVRVARVDLEHCCQEPMIEHEQDFLNHAVRGMCEQYGRYQRETDITKRRRLNVDDVETIVQLDRILLKLN